MCVLRSGLLKNTFCTLRKEEEPNSTSDGNTPAEGSEALQTYNNGKQPVDLSEAAVLIQKNECLVGSQLMYAGLNSFDLQ